MGEAQGDPVHRRLKGRWIDVNKGDSTNCKKRSRYRCRFVAEEFNTGDEDGPFASTPPLEALRLIISDAATRDQEEGRVIVVNDVARAFFEAPARRTICVELPKEETHEGDDVGLLLDQGCKRPLPGGGQEGADQGGAQDRQVQPQHALPREGGHKSCGSWR